MNNSLFDQATSKYAAGDYRGALRAYTACLQDSSTPFSLGEVGLIYHRIGNCLVKLKNYTESIQAYAQALSDPSYSAKGSLENNIGMAYASLHDYDNAVEHFKIAIDDPTYDTPHKAYMGLGNAELKLGHNAEAGVAFREAALDEGNPDPAKALLNLGICFMALDRPEDAILSYESARQFQMGQDTMNRLNASMGQAYAANNQMQQAVDAFEAAIADGTYALSDSASVDYQRAAAAVAQSAAAMSAEAAELTGLDIAADGTPITDNDPFFYDEGYDYDQQAAYPGYVDAYNGDDSRFFETSDEELAQLSKNLAKKDRKHRNVGLKILVVIIILLIAVLGSGVYLYMQGYGYPTQQSIVEDLFKDPTGAANTLFADNLSEESISSMLAPVVTDPNAQLDALEHSMADSRAYVTAHTPEGGNVMYAVSFTRDMIGWKISSVELYFPSQN